MDEEAKASMELLGGGVTGGQKRSGRSWNRLYRRACRWRPFHDSTAANANQLFYSRKLYRAGQSPSACAI